VGSFCQESATDGEGILLGSGVTIGDNVRLISRGGRLRVGRNAFIGDGARIVCQSPVLIGDDVLIAEYVVIRDQDHFIVTSRPSGAGRSSGTDFVSFPVEIGNGSWIGSKVTILKGVSGSNNCVIGAHSLDRSHVPRGSLAVGIPARVVRRGDENAD
jgi:acetyltransferase-like isoleucine patch superfamily enzyme